MKHPVIFDIEKQYPHLKRGKRVPANSIYCVPYAETSSWRHEHFSIIEQDYDAKDAYFSLIEINTRIPLQLNIETIGPDLYWLYQLKGDIRIEQLNFREKNYKVVYASHNSYAIHLKPAHYLTFFFVINSNWFLRQSEEIYPQFEYFRKLMRNKLIGCQTSKAFPITYKVIKPLIQILNAKERKGIVMETNVYSLIARLFNISHDDQKGLLPPQSNAHNLIATARELIVHHIKDGSILSLSELAASLSISPQYLARVHKEHHGHTLANFQKNAKLMEAMRLLREEKLSPTAVAYHLGYDPSNFSRDFYKKFGLSPREA